MLIGLNTTFNQFPSADVLLYNISSQASYYTDSINLNDLIKYKSPLWKYVLVNNFTANYSSEVLFIQQPFVFIENLAGDLKNSLMLDPSITSMLLFPNFVDKELESFTLANKLTLNWTQELDTIARNTFSLTICNNF